MTSSQEGVPFHVAVMEPGFLEPEKDAGKAQFQEELNKWFESRGIIADLRSHLRHLMITALQNTQIGLKPTDRTSPKAQALNLIVAEYLHKHRCHYTLSVFTSEVPTLASFSCINPVLRGQGTSRKKPQENCFQEKEVEEIFNALGMPSWGEEVQRLKEIYSQKGNESSLVELFLEAILQMSTKLQIRQNLESFSEQVEGGKKLLSKKWSSRIVDILLSEKIKQSQITALEQAISRITENEVKRITEEDRRLQMQALADRERRIQEYLKKHEDDIFLRIIEAEKDLVTRKDIIDKELTERQRHLTQMAMEWNSKHEEILRLSKNFHDIEKENKELKRKVEELEAENKNLGDEGEEQNRTIEDLRREMSSLMEKLKQVTESNAILSERLDVLIRRENKEVSVNHDDAKQDKEVPEEIPLLWSRNRALDEETNPLTQPKNNGEVGKMRNQKTINSNVHPDKWNIVGSPKYHCGSGDAESSRPIYFDASDEEDNSLSDSSSFHEEIANVRKKLQDLEEESDRINKNYLEYKLRRLSVDTDSESSKNQAEKFPESPRYVPNIRQDANMPTVIKETKFCQTSEKFVFQNIQKLEERKEKQISPRGSIPKATNKTEESSPKVSVHPPTKRQLQNRDFFLQSRQLLKELLEKENVEELHTTTPSSQVSSCTSSEVLLGNSQRKKKKDSHRSADEPILLTPLRTASFYYNDEPQKKVSVESLPRVDMNCLALLEETRIKSPQDASARKPLRQQILLSESEEKNRESENPPVSKSPKSVVTSPPSVSSGKVSAGKESGIEGFW